MTVHFAQKRNLLVVSFFFFLSKPDKCSRIADSTKGIGKFVNCQNKEEKHSRVSNKTFGVFFFLQITRSL